jgi:hypothetical protein
MISTLVHSPADRLRTVELVHGMFRTANEPDYLTMG